MTDHQVLLIQALERCSFLPASPDKRFVRQMATRSRKQAPPALTEKQAAFLDGLAWRYRRQIPDYLVPARAPV